MDGMQKSGERLRRERGEVFNSNGFAVEEAGLSDKVTGVGRFLSD